MPAPIDLTGQRFGRWTVLRRAESLGRHARWLCECSCGATRPIPSDDLRRGRTRDCGNCEAYATYFSRSTHD
jgi:hypothetical protein